MTIFEQTGKQIYMNLYTFYYIIWRIVGVIRVCSVEMECVYTDLRKGFSNVTGKQRILSIQFPKWLSCVTVSVHRDVCYVMCW